MIQFQETNNKENRMPLWNKFDNIASAPKWLISGNTVPAANTSHDWGGLARNHDKSNAYLVDLTEAASANNRSHGIRTPGWMLYKTYGNGRKYVEVLAVMHGVYANTTGDAGVFGNTAIEDINVPDV